MVNWRPFLMGSPSTASIDLEEGIAESRGKDPRAAS